MHKFQMGGIKATPGVIELFPPNKGQEMAKLLERHADGDWGDLSKSDSKLNDKALISGDRLLSSYETVKGRVWIITEADRSSTTLLLPNEY